MSFVATNPAVYAGQRVGSGECVALVQMAAGAPHTAQWRRGARVRGNQSPLGTAIATFDDDGRYGNHADGRSHAAILIIELTEGLRVWDQWAGHPVAQRTIRWHGGDGNGDPVNDGDAYHVIEVALAEIPAEPR
jgi:hypothetical protein